MSAPPPDAGSTALPDPPAAAPTAHAAGEPARQRALGATAPRADAPIPALDRYARLALRAANAPLSLVSLVDGERLVVAGAAGLDVLPEPCRSARATPPAHSLCQRVVAGAAALVLPDACAPAARPGPAGRGAGRASLGPTCGGEHAPTCVCGVGAYLGVPLATAEGHVLGSMCVIDTQPRPWTEDDLAHLGDLAAAATAELTRHRAAEAALRASELRFQAFADTATDAIVSADARGNIVHWNRGAERIFGYTEAEAVGRSLTMLIPPGYRDGHSRGLARVAGGAPPRLAGQVVSIEAVRKSGEVFPIELATASYAFGGEVCFTSVIRDTTDRTRAERARREQHALFAAVLEGTTDAMWVKDREGAYQLINAAGARMLGRDVASVLGRTDAELFAPESARAVRARDRAVLDGGEARTEETESTSADGVARAYLTTRAPLRDADGRATGVIGVSRDITDRRRHEAARAREARLGLLTTQLPAVLWSVDTALRFTFASGAGVAALGLAPDQIVGLPFTEYLGTSDPDAPALRAVRRALGGRSAEYTSDVGERSYQTHVEPLRDGGGEIAGVLGLSIDITDRCRLEAQLAHQAFHDALTGLANRALFHDRVAHALARRAGARAGAAAAAGAPGAAGPPGGERLAVLFLDLDDFKGVNDSLGHPQGDALLREVAERLRRATRGCDTVARLGGDEFAVLLEGVTGADGAAPAVARIEAALRAPVRLGEGAAARPWRVRASVGVAYAGPGDTADELLRNADVALYAAKSDGKDRHAVFAPAMHAAILSRLELEADLRRAVGRLEHGAQHEAEHAHGGADQGRPAAPAGGFRLVYQPIVEVASGGVVAVEALIRWTRPDGTAVPPADFVPIAEATGLVIPLGRWVLAEACAQAAAWRTRGGATAALRVTVNVSGRQLADCAALADDVATALARSGLPAECLTLEMTESVLMQRTGETLERLAALKALGVRLAIDDFGTGYSSLAYLQRFPVDVLKIDKAFVDGVADEAGDRAIARTVVALGRSLGLVTVAEGVEREDQWAALAELGCDYAQGYLFDRPLEVAAIPGRAAAGRRHVAG